MTTPRIAVQFTGDTGQVAAAVRALTGELRGLTGVSRQQSAAAQQAQAQTASFAERLRVAGTNVGPFDRGLRNLYDQHIRNAQAAGAHARQLDAVAAGMSRAARGTEALNAGFARASQQRAAQEAAATAAATNRAAGATALLASHVGTLAKGYVALRALSLVRQALAEAGALGELSQQTGFAVESLSVLQFGAKQVGLDLDDVATATRRMAVSLGDLRDGNKEARDTFRALGLSARDFQGLSVERSFQLIVDRLAQLPDGLEKAERASRIFGRSGAALIPLLNQLAGDGFGELERAARAANAVIGTDTANAADALGDRVGDLTGALKAFVREGVGPVLPALTEMVRLLTEGAALLGRLPALLKDLPGLSGVPLARLLPFGAGAAPELLGALGRRRAGQETPKAEETGLAQLEAFAAAQERVQQATAEEIRALASLRAGGVATAEELARIEEILGRLRREFANTTDVERRAELQGQITSLVKEQRQEQQALTEAQRQELELMRAQAQEAERTLRAEAERRAVAAEQVRQEGFRRALQQTGGVGSFEELIARQQRDRARAAGRGVEVLSVAEQVARDRAQLEADVLAYIAQLQAEGTATIDVFENLGQSMRESVAGVLDDLFIDGRVSLEEFVRAALTGIQRILDQLIAAEAIGALERLVRGRIPAAPTGLGEQDVGQLAGLAPDLRPAAEAAKVTAAATELGAAGTSVTLGGSAVEAGARALGASAALALSSGSGLREAGIGLGASGTILITAAGQLKEAAIALAAANAVGSAIPGAAGGGYLDGPGSPTSDSFLIRASRTEYMQPARAVRFYGRDFMEDVRHLRFPKFADGGLVGPADFAPEILAPTVRAMALPAVPRVDSGSSAGVRTELAGELRVLLDRGLILDTVRSYMGSRDAETDHIRLSAATRSRRQAGGI